MPSDFTQRSSSFAASPPWMSGTVPSATKRSGLRETYSASPSFTMREAWTEMSSGTV